MNYFIGGEKLKLHKCNVTIMFFLCLMTIAIAFILHNHDVVFWANIFIGITSSSVLALIISLISYHIEKRRALEEFFVNALKAVSNIKQYEKSRDPLVTMDLILKMNDFDYSALDIAYGNIDFMFANNTYRKYIYEMIYSKILDIKNLIREKSFHFREYKKVDNGNLAVMMAFINEIDTRIMERREEFVDISDSKCAVGYNFNKFAEEIEGELNGKYYKIMYGR